MEFPKERPRPPLQRTAPIRSWASLVERAAPILLLCVLGALIVALALRKACDMAGGCA